ncbi:MAG: tRNA (guanosine(37)-N1)-methyltransferase TrmD [Bacteroidetes bacterium]|jgi:tRNA (guanine37-N1)-methyltransferase|nr:tRNA (guanosine(37)-N1)-methyltransferase TrmD [Bacteroidota bacterium]
MLRIDILSGVPDLLRSPLDHSIIGRARQHNHVEIHLHDLREYSKDNHQKIDDTPYGGGAGMVLSPQPIFTCIEKLKSERTYDEIIFTAPDGIPFEQSHANQLSIKKNLMFLCGHYKGVDQRVRDRLITAEFSIGDYVLSGGELPALVMTDAVIRLIPGVLGNAESALSDSFQNELLEGPVYTRPAEFKGMEVPEVLRSGDHKKIKQWRLDQSIKRTQNRRPDLFKKFKKNNEHQ